MGIETNLIKLDEIMAQAQVFASAWALVDTRFDNGNAYQDAIGEKDSLREMLVSLFLGDEKKPLI